MLAGAQVLTMAAGRFERRRLAGVITWPAAEPVFVAGLVGADGPAWTPHVDPRLEALGAGYELSLASPDELFVAKEAHR